MPSQDPLLTDMHHAPVAQAADSDQEKIRTVLKIYEQVLNAIRRSSNSNPFPGFA
jgi:hypothetical protein